jgi:TetR/AcrR family transcriptional regulator
MKVLAYARSSASPKWELAGLGRRVPRSLRQARDLSTARRIVATAEDIFAEQGLAGARMDEIARAAKVNKALLYYYFRSKEELHRFVLETLLSQLREGVGDVGADVTSPRKRLGAIVDNFFDFVLAHPNYPRLMQREIMSRGPNMGWIVAEYYRPLHGRLVRLIEKGISAGEFRRVDARNTAVTVTSIMVHYFAAAPVLRSVLGHDPLRPREVAKRREAVQDFLKHGLFRSVAGTR